MMTTMREMELREVGPARIANISDRKSALTLNFDFAKTKKTDLLEGVLSSPDVAMLKLATPDLDRLVHQQQNQFGEVMISAGTPTTSILFPKSVTEEQEAYARGFVDALLELHSRQGDGNVAYGVPQTSDSRMTSLPVYSDEHSRYVNLDPVVQNGHTRPAYQITENQILVSCNTSNPPTRLQISGTDETTSSPALVESYDASSSNQNRPCNATNHNIVSQARGTAVKRTMSMPKDMKDPYSGAGQCVEFGQPYHHPIGSVSSATSLLSDTTPPISPIDMEQQERIKLERKRLRNRIAATKCRNRKLERIGSLQEVVDQLKSKNSELAATASELRSTVYHLKQVIVDHSRTGCQLMMNS